MSRRERVLAPMIVIAALPLAADVVPLPRGELDDAALVRRARTGDTWAYEVIYRRYVRRIASVAQRILRDPSEVDDVVQETFLIAFENVAALANPSALCGWLTQIAVSRVHRRFRWRRLAGLWGAEPEASLESQASDDASPEQRAELALIDRALQRLPLKLRTPWILRHVIGDSLDDIAVACGCSLATVKRRIGDAEARVRQHLAGDAQCLRGPR
jgi:RNA polymerase sigma-70 factor (ECF subfamily)